MLVPEFVRPSDVWLQSYSAIKYGSLRTHFCVEICGFMSLDLRKH